MNGVSTMNRIMVFDHLDSYVCEISPTKVRDIAYVDEVNGEHSITVTTTQELEKTDRLLIQDGMGTWYEYVVLGIGEGREDGPDTIKDYYCVWSLQYDMASTFVNHAYGAGVVPGHASVPVSPRQALEVALGGTTRWGIGTITVTTMAAASFYRRSGWKALLTVLESWGGELRASITVGASGVVSRKVDLLSRIGSSTVTRRFDYGYDVSSITRTVSDDIWPCRIVPLGKAQETESGGYTRRPSIESVNGGIMWLQDDSVVTYTRVPDGNGGYEYPTLIVENDTYESPADLKAWALEHISDYTRPKVTYTADLIQFAKAGLNPHGVALGDDIAIVDSTFGENGLHISARVVKITGSMLDPTQTTLTIGNVTESLSNQLAGIARQVGQLSDVVANSQQFQATAEYLASLVDRINQEINVTGGYTYITQGEGIRTYDTPVSDPLEGDEASQVVEIKGGTLRIANSRTSSGDWNWKTVIVSGHVAAELVTAAAIVTGFIGSAGGTYIDLDGNTVQLGPSSGNHMVVNNSGMQIYNNNANLAFFGTESGNVIARIGKSDQGNVVMSSAGYVDMRNASTVLAHFGYASGKNASGGTSVAPYYTVGIRKNGTTIGNYSLAEGHNTEASGYASHAEGDGAMATGYASHAEGSSSTASGAYSHAIGMITRATGYGAFATGSYTKASGDYSFAAGYHSEASGDYSFATGSYTKASADNQTVVGNGNATNSNAFFIVGSGTGITNIRNSLEVEAFAIRMFAPRADGSSYTGTVYVNGSSVHSSDRRLKDHVAYLKDDAVEFIRKLRPARFRWKNDAREHMGFYAQDVQDAMPWDNETVIEGEERDGLGYAPLTLDYNALIAPLVAYAQSLEKRIEELEGRL